MKPESEKNLVSVEMNGSKKRACLFSRTNLSYFRKMKNWWRFFIYKSKLDKDVSASENYYVHTLKRWELDYQLEEIDRLHLFDEYIEMSKILQHFITIYLMI